ncbi:MAG: transposase [Phycisphaerales bacterium]
MDPIRKKLRRYEIPGHARFLTCSCDQRQPFFDDEYARHIFADQLMITRSRLGFKLHAWVVMPEHVHLLIHPNLPDAPVSKILMSLKRRVSTKVLQHWRNQGQNTPNQFWQAGGGYDRNIHSTDELHEKVRYIHENPARRGLVDRPHDWVWSSARAWMNLNTEWAEIDKC